jgi:hypothetical protein
MFCVWESLLQLQLPCWRKICLDDWYTLDSILDGCMCLEICSFLLNSLVYLNIGFQSSPDDSLDFIGVCCYLSWVFSFLILVRFANGLLILFIFSINQIFVSLILCIVFFFPDLYFIDFGLYFCYFSFYATFVFSLFLFF